MFQFIRRNYLNLSLAAVAIASAIPASAGIVDYTTTADFNCSGCLVTGNDTGSVTVVYGSGTANTATLVFTGSPAGTSVDSDAAFTTASYGTITASYTGTGAAIDGTTFKLMLDQTMPNVGTTTGILGTATLSGLVFDGKSTSYANFGSSDPRITLGGPVVYELDTSQNNNNASQFGYSIVSPSTGMPPGVTSFQGNIQATPEPTFLTLTGAGFLGLAGIAIRRRRAAARA
jgi:hypothetical protein